LPVTGLAIGAVFTLGMRGGALMDVWIAAQEARITASYGLIMLHVAVAVHHRILRNGVWSVVVLIFKERAR
jgi:tetrahydromethanopterin S-methyltransferase subunit E